MHTTVDVFYAPKLSTKISLPLFMVSVQAGFPAPVDDYIEGRIDLNRYLVKNPTATFFVRVAGDSMKNAGIKPGDILVVDRACEVSDGCIVVAIVDGDFTVKRIRERDGKTWLDPDNENFEPIEVREEFEVWGVVRHAIHSFK